MPVREAVPRKARANAPVEERARRVHRRRGDLMHVGDQGIVSSHRDIGDERSGDRAARHADALMACGDPDALRRLAERRMEICAGAQISAPGVIEG